jgi:hypothetical protein
MERYRYLTLAVYVITVVLILAAIGFAYSQAIFPAS